MHFSVVYIFFISFNTISLETYTKKARPVKYMYEFRGIHYMWLADWLHDGVGGKM